MSDAVVVDGETACGSGRHGVIDAAEPVHASEKESQAAGDCQHEIDRPNPFTLPPTIDGRMAMVKNTIPKPPIHCESERQNRIACGSRASSTLLRTDAPVVVNPEMVSKKASVGLVNMPEKM